MKSSHVLKKVFYYGSTESDPQVLKTDRWYKNRKYIDSLLIDITLYYPIEMKTVSISATTPEKKDHENGGFVWLISNDGKYMDVAVTDDVDENLATLYGVTESGITHDHSRSSYTPKQPSTEMFSYAGKCYTFCQQLIQNIDDGKYRSIKDLIKDFDNNRPTPPQIRWVYRYAFKNRNDIKSIEFKYFTKYDSVTIQNTMAYNSIPRKCDYVIAGESDDKDSGTGIADKNGNWIIKPSSNLSFIDEVAGIFYKINDPANYSNKADKFVYVDEKKRRFIEPDFELKENVNDTVLIVKKTDLLGAVHRSSKALLPIKFASIAYNEDWRLFVTKLDTETPQYQLYRENGKQALPKTYRLIELKGERLYTTELKDDIEEIEAYDKNLQRIKDADRISQIEKEDDSEPVPLKDSIEVIRPLTEDLILVRKTDEILVSEDLPLGVYNKEGEVVIPPIYRIVWYDEPTNLITVMTQKRKFILFHTDGKQALSEEFVKMSQKDGLIYTSKIEDGNEVMSVYDRKIRQINPKNTYIESQFNRSFEPILAKDKDGCQFFMSRDGSKHLGHSNTLQYLDGFHSGRALAMPRLYTPANSVYGYISLDGKKVIPFQYTKAYSFRGQYAYVEENGNAMFIDINNEVYKKLPAKAKNVYLADTIEDTRYFLENGDVYDGNLNQIKECGR